MLSFSYSSDVCIKKICRLNDAVAEMRWVWIGVTRRRGRVVVLVSNVDVLREATGFLT
ncbi:MAG: hypothetical protein H7232_07115 [Aeromicrobium sp.]|nr:hypothetical protein [Burkholderiales bacterium]